MFEKRLYFENIFPRLRIQKPGYDLYGATNTLLAIMAIYVFMFYQNVTVDPAVFGFLKGQSSLFGGEMALVLLVIFTIMLFERYTNRTDTKAEVLGRLSMIDTQGQTQNKQYFKQEELFQRANTARSMTIRIKTLKTSDLDITGTAAQDYLKDMQSNLSHDVDKAKTKITSQQKTKFMMHWVILIGVHIFIFWYVPIHGNYVLYAKAECDMS